MGIYINMSSSDLIECPIDKRRQLGMGGFSSIWGHKTEKDKAVRILCPISDGRNNEITGVISKRLNEAKELLEEREILQHSPILTYNESGKCEWDYHKVLT